MATQQQPLPPSEAENLASEQGATDLSTLPPQQSSSSSSSSSQQKQQKEQPRKRHGARNQHRHKNFVKWIMDTFHECLVDDADHDDDDGGGHILDVAGGKGEVAARLTMCHQKSVVMVDPRPADVVHCFESLVLPKIPNKWQRRLEARRQDDPDFVERTLHARFRQLVTTFDDPTTTNTTTTTTDNHDHDLQKAIEGASLLLGLHADGATEAIVNAALLYQKPFCVVPCCVFPNFFTHRKLRQDDGTLVQVRSHEQFCAYLAQKDSRFRVETLPFEGRNVAIWWDGK
jgi:hypothetical protein